ncbi:HEAT repeat domain-containing protein [Poritiphilus flavus]|uniref:Putative zinc-finger domain-containing protein n=1 Tax=Poritiphilus flavus TaxID=2697053 RepID=A0A6L9E838_9FLAO|nr:HEAT repeat domain-containing protein [Poritiphilus flavus]NAS10763.1 hypothetical protein [Poritiphilus flavus]
MKEQQVSDLLVDYLDGNLDAKEAAMVAKHLEQSPALRAELEETKKLLKAFKEEKTAEPSDRLRSGFYQMLEKEMENDGVRKITSASRPNTFHFLRIAAGIALLFGSFLLGMLWQSNDFESEIASLQTENQEYRQTAMLSLMENGSASRRIQGVSYAEELTALDPEILEALIRRMTEDNNITVRLSALEALSNFTQSEKVKDALIAALETEQDPGMQIQIIQTLVEIQEKKVVSPMQELLESNETEPYVKEHIKSLLPNII